MSQVIGRASAKIILFGEHAVVYGQPAIAAPVLGLQARVKIMNYDGPFVIDALDVNQQGIGIMDDHPLAQMARSVLDHLAIPAPHARLTVRSDIPIASGLGSGAAVSTAIGRALADYAGRTLPKETLNQLVYEIEQLHHGTPSGIDNTVIAHERIVYYIRGQALEIVDNNLPFKLLIGDTGKAALTKVAVGDVRKLMETQQETTSRIVERIGAIAQKARAAMQTGHIKQLGQLMSINHVLLQQLTVSSPELDALVAAARYAGALGAKLSGGGRGGNMIALVTEETSMAVREALITAGATHIIETTVPGRHE